MNDRQLIAYKNPLALATDTTTEFWRGVEHMGYRLSTIVTLNK